MRLLDVRAGVASSQGIANALYALQGLSDASPGALPLLRALSAQVTTPLTAACTDIATTRGASAHRRSRSVSPCTAPCAAPARGLQGGAGRASCVQRALRPAGAPCLRLDRPLSSPLSNRVQRALRPAGAPYLAPYLSPYLTPFLSNPHQPLTHI